MKGWAERLGQALRSGVVSLGLVSSDVGSFGKNYMSGLFWHWKGPVPVEADDPSRRRWGWSWPSERSGLQEGRGPGRLRCGPGRWGGRAVAAPGTIDC